MDRQQQVERAYAAARSSGRAGRATRKALRRAAASLGFHLVTGTYRVFDDGATTQGCARCSGRLTRVSEWFIHAS